MFVTEQIIETVKFYSRQWNFIRKSWTFICGVYFKPWAFIRARGKYLINEWVFYSKINDIFIHIFLKKETNYEDLSHNYFFMPIVFQTLEIIYAIEL